MDLFEKYLSSAYHFLNYRPRSVKEVRDNLKKKKASDEVIEKIITKLKEQKFLNDEEFARMWVESRVKNKPRSLFFLKMELQQKGISKDIIEHALVSSESGIQNDLGIARELVAKKIKKYRTMEKQVIYQKLGGVLGRKGFSWDVSKKAIDEALQA